MGKMIYPRGFDAAMKNWLTDTFGVLLVRETSSYVPDLDHDFLDDFTTGGGVYISVASYAHQILASKAKAWDATKNQFEYDCADPAFGNLEAGQTVKAAIVARQVGGDWTTPADDDLILYDDGKQDVVLAADAAGGATQVWVQPLESALPNSTAIDFGGGATATLTAAAARGDRSLSCTALGAAATAGDISVNTDTDSILPAVLQNGPFNLQVHGDGLLVLARRGDFAA